MALAHGGFVFGVSKGNTSMKGAIVEIILLSILVEFCIFKSDSPIYEDKYKRCYWVIDMGNLLAEVLFFLCFILCAVCIALVQVPI